MLADPDEVEDFSRYHNLCHAVLKGEDVTRFHNAVIRAVGEFGQPLGVYLFAHDVALARIKRDAIDEKPTGASARSRKHQGR